MAAGLRLPRSNHGIFLLSRTFQTQHLQTGYRTGSTGCPTDLQHLCYKALINTLEASKTKFCTSWTSMQKLNSQIFTLYFPLPFLLSYITIEMNYKQSVYKT